ncbi:MAG: hypothetical protein COA96_05820 [SAR86 cluster bacterium]|uniref:Histidine phosphatase family protein n=1 Tax=SAR86 cluster bacterium TaxID=2030880 RepID=A0A2A5B3Z7_9GAMM|nr:MAG: hypothetical protein COA96_05820 [SAR86 cluster bacterium]
MSEIILVRHGQASFGKESYDKLSQKGIDQVKILAAHWQETGERFDFIYSGTLLRQNETANELLSLVSSNPTRSTEHASLNEYDGDPLVRVYLRDYGAQEGFGDFEKGHFKDEKKFQRVLEATTAKWIRNELQPQSEDTHFEYWADFQQRVHAVIDEIMQKHTGGARVLVSTSGGVIAMALQRVLQFPDEQVISTNWMVRNSSVTRVKYGQGKVSLTQFNSMAHLERADRQHMITYR